MRRHNFSRIPLIAVLLFVVAGTALAQQSPETPPTTANNQGDMTFAADGDQRYRLGAGDIIEVRILNRPTLSREGIRIEGNGMIRMPLIDDEIMAACKTEGELAKDIASKYLKFYRNPQVDVFVKEYKSKQVAVLGAVNQQSRFELQRRIRLLELLTFASGPSPKAGQTINIVHTPPALTCSKNDERDEVARVFSSYKLSDTMKGDPASNPWIQPGDIVTVPEAPQAYVVGNVGQPITIPLREPVPISRAIAMAGGFKIDSKKDKVRILRQDPGASSSKELIVDLQAIQKKQAEDVLLMPNDIVDVPTSGTKSFLRTLMGSVVPSVASLPVRVVP